MPDFFSSENKANNQAKCAQGDKTACAVVAAQTAKALASGSEEEKAAAVEAAAMMALAMAPGGVFAVAVYSAFMALAGLFPAHGTVPVTDIPIRMWQPQTGCFDPSCFQDPPLMTAWKQAIATIELVWNVVRIAKKMAPAPVAIRAEFLVPLDPADRLTKGGPDTLLINPNPNAGIGPETMIQGADQCLLYWLNAYAKGWGTQLIVVNGGRVQNTDRPGDVGSAIAPAGLGTDGAATNAAYSIGRGPFGLDFFSTWPSDCQGKCQTYIVDCVRALWTYRLEALNKSMPELVGAVMGQIITEQYASPKAERLSISTSRLGELYNAALQDASNSTGDDGWSTTTKVTVSVLTLGALGGLGYWLRKTKKWPFK